MRKERVEKDLVVRVQPSLFRQFQQKCEENYKTVSEVIRELMRQYTKEKKVREIYGKED